MKNYCCQILSVSGRLLEEFHENYFDAVNEANSSIKNGHAKTAKIFRYPNMKDPICVLREIT